MTGMPGHGKVSFSLIALPSQCTYSALHKGGRSAAVLPDLAAELTSLDLYERGWKLAHYRCRRWSARCCTSAAAKGVECVKRRNHITQGWSPSAATAASAAAAANEEASTALSFVFGVHILASDVRFPCS